MALAFMGRFVAVPRAPVSVVAVRWGSKKIDTSRVPVIPEEDIEEKFVRGQGPGGQSVAKNANCAILCHKPTGKSAIRITEGDS